MKIDKKWLWIGGGFATIVVIGLAVGLNQGGLFKGSLSDRSISLKPSASATNSEKAVKAGQSLDDLIITSPATGYNIFGDKKNVQFNSKEFKFLKSVPNVYLRLEKKSKIELQESGPQGLEIKPNKIEEKIQEEKSSIIQQKKEEISLGGLEKNGLQDLVKKEEDVTSGTILPPKDKNIPNPPTEEIKEIMDNRIKSTKLHNAIPLAHAAIDNKVKTLNCTFDSSNVCEIDVSSYPSGTYNIKFNQNNETLFGLQNVKVSSPLGSTSAGLDRPTDADADVVDKDGVGDTSDNDKKTTTTPTDADDVDKDDKQPAEKNDGQKDTDKDGVGDTSDNDKKTTTTPTDAATTSTQVYNYSYNYYTSPDQTAQSVTQPTTTPCVVADKTFYLAGGPKSAYCKDLQSMVNAEGKQEIFKADMTPETPQARYTTALAALRVLRELGASIRTRNLSTDWYNKLSDSETIRSVSAQELADFRTVYASGILKGRINPKNQSDVTLAPLGKVSYIELMAMFRQAIVDSLGVSVEINEANLPAFILTEYARNPDWEWIAQAYSFGVDFDLITKNEFNKETLFNYATRADMVRFLARFQDAVVANPSLIK